MPTNALVDGFWGQVWYADELVPRPDGTRVARFTIECYDQRVAFTWEGDLAPDVKRPVDGDWMKVYAVIELPKIGHDGEVRAHVPYVHVPRDGSDPKDWRFFKLGRETRWAMTGPKPILDALRRVRDGAAGAIEHWGGFDVPSQLELARRDLEEALRLVRERLDYRAPVVTSTDLWK